MHGKGNMTWKDGRKYEGDYQNDKRHGQGIYTWPDGRKYRGPWLNGKQHGEGEYILPNGKTRRGLWNNGQRDKWIDGGDDMTTSTNQQFNNAQTDMGQSTFNNPGH